MSEPRTSGRSSSERSSSGRSASGGSSSGRSRSRRQAAKRRRLIIRSSVALGILLLCCVAWVGVRGLMAKNALEDAAPLAERLVDQLGDGDLKTARSTYAQLASHTARATDLTGDPIWRAFEIIPAAGPNLHVMRRLAEIVNTTVEGAVQPIITVGASFTPETLIPETGAVDLQPLVDARAAITVANSTLQRASADADALDTTSGTLTQLADAADKLRPLLHKAADASDVAHRVAALAPAMLGADGPRDYLLLFQNPAELRSGGGIPGAVALLHTEKGSFDLTAQASSSDFTKFDASVLPLPVETQGLYGEIVGQYIQNVTMTPDFALSGALASEMWKQQFGQTVDGAIAIDPVALSYLLKATGPITLPTGDQLTADNAVQLLLSDVYARYPVPAHQDLFFAAAADAVFDAVAHGAGEPIDTLKALAQGAAERRILIWNSRPDEQRLLSGTTLAGELPTSTEDEEHFGVYLNDAVGSKMNYHTSIDINSGSRVCRQDGIPEYSVEVTITNQAPADAVQSLPPYVTGGGAFGVTPGNVKIIANIYGPPDAANLGIQRDGQPVDAHAALDQGRTVSAIQVELVPGESTTIRASFLAATPGKKMMVTQSTPVVHGETKETLSLGCEIPL